MKKIQRLDARKNIRKRRVSYLSIIVIAMLAVNAYLGISFAAEAMITGPNHFYANQSFEDLEVISTLLLSESSLDIIRKTEGVADAEGVRSVNARTGSEEYKKNITVLSVPERINVPILLSGRMPERKGECAVEHRLAKELGISEGDTLTFQDTGEGLTSLLLSELSCTVTGIFVTPEHISEEVVFDPYVYVTKDAFNETILRQDVMKAVIRVKDAPENRYSTEYFDSIKQVEKRLEDLSGELTEKRSEEIRQLLDEKYSELLSLVFSYRSDPDSFSEYSTLLRYLGSSGLEAPSGLSLSGKEENIGKIMESLGLSRIIVLNNKANSGYVFTEQSAGNVKNLSVTFSLLFIFVGALVIYSTVGRMVDDDSKLVGAEKAMGLFTREILEKYLAYGVSATMIGTVLGIVTAYFAFQSIILSQYRGFFVIERFSRAFLPMESFLVTVGALAAAVLSVLFSCTRLLKSSAVTLMAGSIPKGSRKKAKNSRSKNLYTRLILLNMRSDAKRVIVTIISVAGCCSLLMIGFTLKYSLSKVGSRQFDEIMHFDAEVSFDPLAGEITDDGELPEGSAANALSSLLDEEGIDHLLVYTQNMVFSGDDGLSVGKLVCADKGEISAYYTLRDVKTGSLLEIPSEELLIAKRFSEYYDIAPGDTVTFYDSIMNPCEATVCGTFVNYIDQLTFCSKEYCEKIYGTVVKDNCILLKMGGSDMDALRKKLSSVDGFLSLTPADARRSEFEQYAGIVNYLIVILGFMAALMAYFILLNLINSYIAGKKRELTIMRINGYTVEETVKYASIEMRITQAAGILLGLAGGAWLGYRIIRLLEKPFLQYVREPDWRSFVFSACITAVLSWLISAFALRKVKNLKLSDI